MRKSPAAVLSFILLVLHACRQPMSSLNRLAGQGLIDDGAPLIARVQIQIAAPTDRVWDLLVDAASWSKWNQAIESVELSGSLGNGANFTWKSAVPTFITKCSYSNLNIG